MQSRVNWQSLSELPVVRAVATAIVRDFDLWVGLTTQAGLVLPIRPLGHTIGEQGPNQRVPVCELFLRRSDTVGSCRASLLRWAHVGEVEHQCHAGLRSHTRAISAPDGSVGVLYASGYLVRDRPLEQLAVLFDRAEALGYERARVGKESESIPRVSTQDLDVIGRLLDVVVDAIRAELASTLPVASRDFDYSHIIGNSPAVQRLFDTLDRVVKTTSTVLVLGENGTGKELIARAIHANSRRRDRVFLTQNCSAIADSLLDSELFGHCKGAFTGAIADKRGLFELADGGTLFLDEVGDMSPTMQVKLLRILQEGTFLPVGDSITRRVDVRIIAATNRILEEMVADGVFREDLYYRLNVINIEVPPLRERLTDLSLLIDHFVTDYTRRSGTRPTPLAAETRRTLERYHWPGNIRELRHEIERLMVLGAGQREIAPDVLTPRIREGSRAQPRVTVRASATLPEAVEALERRMIEEALMKCGGNKTRAAKKLGVSRRNLIRKVQRYAAAAAGIDRGEDSNERP